MNTSKLEQFNATMQAFQKERAEIKPFEDEGVKKRTKKLVASCKKKLVAEYDLYTIYQRAGLVYALIYAFYREDKGVKYEDIDSIALEDAVLVHRKIERSDIPVDYIFVVPYYDFIDPARGNVTASAVVTEGF